MGNLCSDRKVTDVDETSEQKVDFTNNEAKNEANDEGEGEERNTVAGRRPTKGAGLLGKSEWSDDEDEEEGEQNGQQPETPKDAAPKAEEVVQVEPQEQAANDCPEVPGESCATQEANDNENVEISDVTTQSTSEQGTCEPEVEANAPEDDTGKTSKVSVENLMDTSLPGQTDAQNED